MLYRQMSQNIHLDGEQNNSRGRAALKTLFFFGLVKQLILFLGLEATVTVFVLLFSLVEWREDLQKLRHRPTKAIIWR